MSRRDRGSTAVLERLLDPESRSLNIEAARKLVQLKVDAQTQARVDELARKCNEGALTPEEASEYDRYIAFADFVAILQAKARLLLAKNSFEPAYSGESGWAMVRHMWAEGLLS